MTLHDRKETREWALREGQEIELPAHLMPPPPGSPRDWLLDDFGMPLWISEQPDAEFGPFVVIVPSSTTNLPEWRTPWLKKILAQGPACMPSVHLGLALKLARAGETKRGKGNPGRKVTQRELVRWCAWMTDVREASAKELIPHVASAISDPREDRRKVQRYIADGRSLLATEGAFPWALWQDGKLPATWWRDIRFLHGLAIWYSTYVRKNREILKALRQRFRADAALAQAIGRRRREVEALRRQMGLPDVEPNPALEFLLERVAKELSGRTAPGT